MSEDKLELQIQRELVEFLRARGWYVERMLANAYQTGIPDLYCFQKKSGERWVEVKRPKDYTFTKRQRQKWPQWEKAGIGIWIGSYDRLCLIIYSFIYFISILIGGGSS